MAKEQEGGSALDKLLAQMQQAQATAQAATTKREAEIRAITDEIIQRYQPGGAFEKAGMAQIGLAKTQAVGGGLQRLISSGLAGTEAAGGLETGFEQGAGARMRMSLEDIMMQRLSSAQMGKAGFVERIQDVGPDPGLIAQLAMQAGQAPTGAVDGGPRYDKGPSPWEPGFMGGGWTLGGGGGGGAAPAGAAAPTTAPRYEAEPIDREARFAEERKGFYWGTDPTTGKLLTEEQYRAKGTTPTAQPEVAPTAAPAAAPSGAAEWRTKPGSKYRYKIQGGKAVGFKTKMGTYYGFRKPTSLGELGL